MNTIYLVCLAIDYEGDDVDDVYTRYFIRESAAYAYKDKMNDPRDLGMHFEVYEIEPGEEA